MRSLSSTARIAWVALGVNLITVLGGTLVRATGSGAGCGQSWPSCQGELLPGLGTMATRIEFAHRFASGLALLSVLVLFVSVYRNYERGRQERRAVQLTAISIAIESLLGAWLVLARLVEDDASWMRAVSVPIHLVNTLLLLAALTSTAWILTTRLPLRWPVTERKKLFVALSGLMLLGASGAIAALADTLFPAESLASGLAADFDGTAHFLTRLRMVHPALAICVGAFLLHLAGSTRERARRPALALLVLVLVQFVVGAGNVLLLTPIPVQILHLLLADLVWISVVLLGAELGRAEGAKIGGEDRGRDNGC